MEKNHDCPSPDEKHSKSSDIENNEGYDNEYLENPRLDEDEEVKTLGISGEKMLAEILSEIGVMYTYARNARISLPETLVSNISTLLSDNLDDTEGDQV